MIEYQYRGLPHAHLVARLKDAPDISDQNNEDLINFVNSHFTAELPRFEGEEHQNIYTKMNWESEFTQEYKEKAVEMVRMHNTHKCSSSINGCKKDINAECKRGYSRGEIVCETFVNKGTNRVVYRRRTKNDLLIVPYNLQMMMDWDSRGFLTILKPLDPLEVHSKLKYICTNGYGSFIPYPDIC